MPSASGEQLFEEMLEVLENYHDMLELAHQYLGDYVYVISHMDEYKNAHNYVDELVPVSYDSEEVYFVAELWNRGKLHKYELEMPLAYIYSSEYRLRLNREHTLHVEQQHANAKQAKQAAQRDARETRKALYEELKKEFE